MKKAFTAVFIVVLVMLMLFFLFNPANTHIFDGKPMSMFRNNTISSDSTNNAKEPPSSENDASFRGEGSNTEVSSDTDSTSVSDSQTTDDSTASLPNPASKYCKDSGGELELVTNKDGSQFGMCKLTAYACEEWTFFRKECDIAGDAEKIKQALIKKGLNLTGMKIVINKHLGKYIAGGVEPVSEPAGGGYFFAVKDGGQIAILADGNGTISCSAFVKYPDYPVYLVPECVDSNGNPVER
jgi:putative hemolysin